MKLSKRDKQWLVWALRQMADTATTVKYVRYGDEETGFWLTMDTREGICGALPVGIRG